MNVFLKSTDIIDWQHPEVVARARALASGCEGPVAIARQCFEWVRDEIKHSHDHGLQPVTCSASEVLKVGSGICFAKSHLLAALLRANGIPTALCYQRLRLDDGTTYSLHGLNAVQLPECDWYRLDARGNRSDVEAQFTPPIEQLAFRIRAPGENDVPGLFADPLPVIVAALTSNSTMDELWKNLPDLDLSTTNDLLRESYSVGYDQAAAEFFGRRRANTHAAFFLPHLRPGMRLLDGGCGPGTMTIELAEIVAPAEVVGIDIEPSQIELARTTAAERGVSNVRYEVADLYSLPFPDESFDAVLLHGVLEHLSDPVRGLREVLRVLKRGGVLGARHADFGGFLLEPASPPLDQFVPMFERLMLHNGADPRAGRHQLRWLTEAGFTRIELSASYDCWTSTPEQKRVSVRFLESLVSDSAFARQLVAAGLVDLNLLDALRAEFKEWAANPVSFAAEAWTEAVGWRK